MFFFLRHSVEWGCKAGQFNVDVIIDTVHNKRLLFVAGCYAYQIIRQLLFIIVRLHHAPRFRVNMASESPSTSPPAVAGRSFFIENLLNHSDNTKKEKHLDGLAGNLSNYPFSTSSFSFVPRAVPQLSYDGLNFPLSTNLSKFSIGEIYYPHSVKFIGQFPVSNNRHPLGKINEFTRRQILVLNIVVRLVLLARMFDLFHDASVQKILFKFLYLNDFIFKKWGKIAKSEVMIWHGLRTTFPSWRTKQFKTSFPINLFRIKPVRRKIEPVYNRDLIPQLNFDASPLKVYPERLRFILELTWFLNLVVLVVCNPGWEQK